MTIGRPTACQCAQSIRHFRECSKAVQIPVRGCLLFVSQCVLDGKQALALLCQNGSSQMPDGMKTERFHLGLGAKPFHHVGCRFVRLPDVRLNRASEHMVAFALTILPQPKHGSPHVFIHGHFVTFCRACASFTRGQHNCATLKIHILLGQLEQFALTGCQVEKAGQHGLLTFWGRLVNLPEILFWRNVPGNPYLRIPLAGQKRIRHIQRKVV